MQNVPQSSRTSTPEVADRARTLFDGVAVGGPRTRQDTDFVVVVNSPEFRDLRRRFRRFVFPMSAAFLFWYLGYVVLAAYFPEFMAIRLSGEINIGLVLGVGQFLSTLLFIAAYSRFAARQLDPRVSELRRSALGEESR